MSRSTGPRRRLLAAAAGAALVAGALGPLATSASAADYPFDLTGPQTVRVGQTGTFVMSAAPGGAAIPAGTYCVFPESDDPGTISGSPQTAALGTGQLTFTLGFSAAGAFNPTVLKVADGTSSCPASAPIGGTIQAVTTVYASGAPVTVNLFPPFGQAAVGAAVPFTWAVEDANGIATPLTGSEQVAVRSTSTTTGFNGASANALTLGPGAPSGFTAQDSRALTATLTATLRNAGGTAVDTDSAILTTVPAGTLTVTPAVATTQVGGSTAFTATLLGGQGFPVAGVAVTATVVGRNAAASATVATTNASGQATWTLVDTAPGTSVATQDVVTFGANGLTATATVTYSTAPPVVSGIALETASDPTTPIGGTFAAVPASGPVYRTGTTAFSVNTALNTQAVVPAATSTWAFVVRATVRNAAGQPLPNVPVAIAGAAASALVLGGSVAGPTGQFTTDALGRVRFVVLSTATGNASWRLTAGASTATLTAAYANALTDARTLTASPTSVSMQPSTPTAVVATVVDRFGNPVAGVPVAMTTPAGGAVTFVGGTSSASGATNASGQFSAQVTGAAAGTGSVTAAVTQTGSQVNDPAGTVAGVAVPGVAAGVGSVTVPVTITAAPVQASVAVVSPTTGTQSSTGARFTVWFRTTNVPAGTAAFLTFNGSATARANVDADGLTSIVNVPARDGQYAMRIGGGGAGPVLATSQAFALDIAPFGLTSFTRSGNTLVFAAQTGAFSRGTPILLTLNGIGRVRAAVGVPGQPITITAPYAPGAYTVRVTSNQGNVFGDPKGVQQVP